MQLRRANCLKADSKQLHYVFSFNSLRTALTRPFGKDTRGWLH
jgi:hypothetical protein